MNITFAHIGREHLGIEYLSSMLKGEGHNVSLAYDPGLFGPEDNVFYIPLLERFFEQKNKIISKIKASKPDLICFTVYTSTYRWACDMAREVKRSMDLPIVFGGVHATLVPEVVMANNYIDFVIQGEGEYALPELARALSCKRDPYDIDNLWYKKGGKIIANKLRPPISDLDSLPLPDKGLFEEYVNYKYDYTILGSRGCAFNCSYCCEGFMSRLYGNKFYRRRSIRSVIEELSAMKKRYDFREVMFSDAVLFTDKVWAKDLLREYKDEINVPFRCFGSFKFIDDEACKSLKAAGCYCIQFGMQTVNESLKAEVLNRRETNKRALEAMAACGKERLRYDVDHMMGLPGETLEDYIEGARFYKGLKFINRIKCHNLTYFPHLHINEIASKKGMLNEGDIKDIEAGDITDFFHRDLIKDKDSKKIKDAFQKLYKLLPIIPDFLLKFIIRKRLYGAFRYIPSPLMLLGQILVAIRGRDYRYIVYFKYYPFRVMKAVKDRFFPRHEY
jgi:radical SAM superfamily enzyme YgiQ (UPF0313 family)